MIIMNKNSYIILWRAKEESDNIFAKLDKRVYKTTGEGIMEE